MLRKAPSLSKYQMTSIAKHYGINNQILAAFELHYEQKLYHVAYAMGLQFIETALLEIPKHGYYYSKRHERERMQSALDALRVAYQLQELHCQLHVPPAEQQRVDRLSDLALEQVHEASNDQSRTLRDSSQDWDNLAKKRSQTEEELRNIHDDQKWLFCEPFLSCSDSISGLLFRPGGEALTEHQTTLPSSRNDTLHLLHESPATWNQDTPSFATVGLSTFQSTRPRSEPQRFNQHRADLLENHRSSSMVHSRNIGMDDSHTSLEALAIPALSRTSTDETTLEKALFLSGLKITKEPTPDTRDELPGYADTHKSEAFKPTSHKLPTYHNRLELSTLSALYHEDFDSLQKSGGIRVSYIATYQGRIPGSTNGCTAIAPLLCIHHLWEESDGYGNESGLTDTTILQVIDEETPAILKQVRTQLALSPQAFLIPSDVHDYLIKNGQLSQQQFVTVLGGNILDEEHLRAIISSLQDSKHANLAATLFFHEHVVAILRVRRGPNKFYYDLIDSLPHKHTVMRLEESEIEFHHRLGLALTQEELEDMFLPMTVRIRCLDEEALTACLRWYACSKFTEENEMFIDTYAWDESTSDFDPRVFQVFIWRLAAE